MRGNIGEEGDAPAGLQEYCSRIVVAACVSMVSDAIGFESVCEQGFGRNGHA